MESTVETLTLQDGKLVLIVCNEPNLLNYGSEKQKKELKVNLKPNFSTCITISYYLKPEIIRQSAFHSRFILPVAIVQSVSKKESNIHLQVDLESNQGAVAVREMFAAMDGVRQPLVQDLFVFGGENIWKTSWENLIPSCGQCADPFRRTSLKL